LKFHVVIPARFAAERLPGKPLVKIAGRALVERVYERAAGSGAADVAVATDDDRIAAACRDFGASVVMTPAELASGTDRVAAVAVAHGWHEDEIVVNVQGDEPLMPPALIDAAAALLEEDTEAGIGTLAAPLEEAEFTDPAAVKVVCDRRGRALYFSRAPIPASRSGAWPTPRLRHIGLYAYRVATLARLAALPPCPLEMTERLEQLRALWNGIAIAVAVVDAAPPGGVDTPADVERVERLIAAGAS
jgi:3-deoxy-manno-octulosonate cytidylyltransferase (CMP-KDO synthetase)